MKKSEAIKALAKTMVSSNIWDSYPDDSYVLATQIITFLEKEIGMLPPAKPIPKDLGFYGASQALHQYEWENE